MPSQVDYFLTDGNADAPQLLTWSGRVNDKSTASSNLKKLTAGPGAAAAAAKVAEAAKAPEAAKATAGPRKIAVGGMCNWQLSY